MIAVLRHELRTYFHSFTTYLFGTFLLCFVGIGALLYNIQAAVSNFEFVLSFSSIVFAFIVPVLSMRSIADERKQKTDQLLYALPITTTDIVVGKFLALVVAFLIPLAIIGVYPLIFAQYGDVYLLTAYGSLFAFFLLGAALLAVGLFVSSLTENQGFAAGIGIALILLNYYSVSLSEFVSSTSFGSLVACLVLAVVLGIVVGVLTKSELLAYIVGGVPAVAAFAVYLIAPDSLADVLPTVMTNLSLFGRFTGFVNGVFDLTAIVFYLSVMTFFGFLTVQSLEKRRYA